MKRSRLSRKKGLKRQSYRSTSWKEIEDLHREAVMVRFGIGEFPGKKGRSVWRGPCLKCGRQNWLQCAHLYPKGKYPNSRYDSDNAIPLCALCHIFWWHKHPIDAAVWIREKLGADYMDRLEIRVKSAGRPDLEATRLYLQAEIRKMRA